MFGNASSSQSSNCMASPTVRPDGRSVQQLWHLVPKFVHKVVPVVSHMACHNVFGYALLLGPFFRREQIAFPWPLPFFCSPLLQLFHDGRQQGLPNSFVSLKGFEPHTPPAKIHVLNLQLANLRDPKAQGFNED